MLGFAEAVSCDWETDCSLNGSNSGIVVDGTWILASASASALVLTQQWHQHWENRHSPDQLQSAV